MGFAFARSSGHTTHLLASLFFMINHFISIQSLPCNVIIAKNITLKCITSGILRLPVSLNLMSLCILNFLGYCH